MAGKFSVRQALEQLGIANNQYLPGSYQSQYGTMNVMEGGKGGRWSFDPNTNAFVDQSIIPGLESFQNQMMAPGSPLSQMAANQFGGAAAGIGAGEQERQRGLLGSMGAMGVNPYVANQMFSQGSVGAQGAAGQAYGQAYGDLAGNQFNLQQGVLDAISGQKNINAQTQQGTWESMTGLIAQLMGLKEGLAEQAAARHAGQKSAAWSAIAQGAGSAIGAYAGGAGGGGGAAAPAATQASSGVTPNGTQWTLR